MNTGNKTYALYLVTAVFVLVHVLFSIFPAIPQHWDNLFNDHLFNMRIEHQGMPLLSTQIVHVDLNDEAFSDPLSKGGSKDFLAEVIRRLGNAGVRAIVVDMFFDGRTPQHALIETSKQLPLLYYPLILRVDDSDSDTVPEASELFTPMEGLVKSARGMGHINIKRDSDGVIRRYPLIIRYQQHYIPSIALQVALDYFNVDRNAIEVVPGSFVKLPNARFKDGRVADLRIPVDAQGYLPINFTGRWFEVFPHYSLKKILFATEAQQEDLYDELEGSIVILSDTSTWGKDFGNTPLEHMYPLSGIHSNALGNILQQNFVYHASAKATLLLTLMVWLLVTLCGYIKRVSYYVAAMALLFFSAYAGALFGFMHYTWLVPVAGVFASTTLSFVLLLSLRYLLEQWQKELLVNRFRGYFSASLMEKIIQSPALLNNIEEKSLAVMFTDIAGFTRWSSTRDPETIRMVLNAYFSKMAPIVFKYRGTIDKYIGDGLMVFFGDPEELENASRNALRAALEMQEACEELRTLWGPSDVMDLHIRIGINFGKVVVGNMGSQERMDYTVLGSHVNLAQRLESNAPVDGILISEAVYDAVKASGFALEQHADVAAKGFTEPVKTYTVSR